MIFSLLLVVFVSLASSQAVPRWTPFNLNETGYIIRGKFYSVLGSNLPFIPEQIGDSVMVIDPQNNRMMWDLGFGSAFVNLQDSAYVFNSSVWPGCMKVPGWTYAKQVSAYRGATALPGSNPGKATFTGECGDIGGCEHFLSLTVELINGIVKVLRFDQKIHLPWGHYLGQAAGSSICTTAQGVIEYDMSTLDRNPANRAQYFQLPSSCATPSNYCDLAYPVDNACAIPQKK